MVMHLTRILLLLAITVVSVRAADPLPSTYDFTNLSKRNLLDASRYRLKFLRGEPDKDHGQIGLFAFRHTLDDPVKLWGFGFQKDGSFRVRFEQFSKWDGNR